eukprot:TRINITY_DN12820_c0_g1_i2.p1 TRINITY_DN12820_c0_g1~~TRINITY_DN12820_c0_g1_i2.p1  ORF type:complete len:163 (+),score=13.12 TRINITY_DN12820_c0_g1_i2:25-513(+)
MYTRRTKLAFSKVLLVVRAAFNWFLFGVFASFFLKGSISHACDFGPQTLVFATIGCSLFVSWNFTTFFSHRNSKINMVLFVLALLSAIDYFRESVLTIKDVAFSGSLANEMRENRMFEGAEKFHMRMCVWFLIQSLFASFQLIARKVVVFETAKEGAKSDDE